MQYLGQYLRKKNTKRKIQNKVQIVPQTPWDGERYFLSLLKPLFQHSYSCYSPLCMFPVGLRTLRGGAEGWKS